MLDFTINSTQLMEGMDTDYRMDLQRRDADRRSSSNTAIGVEVDETSRLVVVPGHAGAFNEQEEYDEGGNGERSNLEEEGEIANFDVTYIAPENATAVHDPEHECCWKKMGLWDFVGLRWAGRLHGGMHRMKKKYITEFVMNSTEGGTTVNGDFFCLSEETLAAVFRLVATKKTSVPMRAKDNHQSRNFASRTVLMDVMISPDAGMQAWQSGFCLPSTHCIVSMPTGHTIQCLGPRFGSSSQSTTFTTGRSISTSNFIVS